MKNCPVGNLNSNERGTAARFNEGKVPYQFLDFQVLSDSLQFISDKTDDVACFQKVVDCLAKFQHGGSPSDLYASAYILAYYLNTPTTIANSAWQHIPWDDCARVFEYGSKKYCSWNWLKGQNWSVPLACAMRHLLKIIGGELIDDESGLSHFGHFLANIMMLAYFYEAFPDGDDRPPFIKPE